MFDLRYHVASLVAVFLALIIGILVGVGISDRGLIDKANRKLLEQRLTNVQNQLKSASQRSRELDREQQAAQTFIAESYPILVQNRLRGKRIAVVFVGSVDSGIRSAVERTLTDAGALQLRLRALKVPVDPRQITAALASQPTGAQYTGSARLESLGKALGDELMTGGETPLWNALAGVLIEEQAGGNKRRADGVVVVRTVPPQRGGTNQLLRGLYQGLAAAGVPAVGVETTDTKNSAVEVYGRTGLSTVDDIDRPTGRFALVLLLAGATPGQYGLKPSADNGSLPPLETPSLPGG
jgi:copper transport outer membrane protein MctB